MAGLFFIPAPVLKQASIYLSCHSLEIESRFRFCKRSSTKARVNSLPTADGLHTPQTKLANLKFMLLPSPVPAASGRFRLPAEAFPDGGVTARRSSIWLP